MEEFLSVRRRGGGGDGGDSGLEFGDILSDDDDVGALGREQFRYAEAKALRAARDNCRAGGDGEVILAAEEGHGEEKYGEGKDYEGQGSGGEGDGGHSGEGSALLSLDWRILRDIDVAGSIYISPTCFYIRLVYSFSVLSRAFTCHSPILKSTRFAYGVSFLEYPSGSSGGPITRSSQLGSDGMRVSWGPTPRTKVGFTRGDKDTGLNGLRQQARRRHAFPQSRNFPSLLLFFVHEPLPSFHSVVWHVMERTFIPFFAILLLESCSAKSPSAQSVLTQTSISTISGERSYGLPLQAYPYIVRLDCPHSA